MWGHQDMRDVGAERQIKKKVQMRGNGEGAKGTCWAPAPGVGGYRGLRWEVLQELSRGILRRSLDYSSFRGFGSAPCPRVEKPPSMQAMKVWIAGQGHLALALTSRAWGPGEGTVCSPNYGGF